MAKLPFMAIAALIAGIVAAPAIAENRPIVIELFTSQGCSSCPPADELLSELARRRDVLALGFHVSYWNSRRWTDPLSSEEATERQINYARRFNGGQVYTPQIVVEGAGEMVGSDREAVMAALARTRPLTIASVAFATDRRSVAIGAGPGGGGTILLLRFTRHRTTPVAGGENAGRVIEDSNAVAELRALGTWQGSTMRYAIEPPRSGEGLAVLVQGRDGKILGAGSVTAPGS